MENPTEDAGKVSVIFNGTELPQYRNQAAQDEALEQIAAFPQWTIKLNGIWDATLDAALDSEAEPRAKVRIRISVTPG